jgi:hypothetical protein
MKIISSEHQDSHLNDTQLDCDFKLIKTIIEGSASGTSVTKHLVSTPTDLEEATGQNNVFKLCSGVRHGDKLSAHKLFVFRDGHCMIIKIEGPVEDTQINLLLTGHFGLSQFNYITQKE